MGFSELESHYSVGEYFYLSIGLIFNILQRIHFALTALLTNLHVHCKSDIKIRIWYEISKNETYVLISFKSSTIRPAAFFRSYPLSCCTAQLFSSHVPESKQICDYLISRRGLAPWMRWGHHNEWWSGLLTRFADCSAFFWRRGKVPPFALWLIASIGPYIRGPY